ncbi:hypothetical protein K435DRAFT_970954 [Dendrothele bispora CBS 962.96]|uniref:Pre-rRNA-processing protein PNO1 n=1 Tax=Dendrothele bispora (strain CBS 962.96) TaxID=1314807 RepID=A0A4S8L885_DENBC|nr:hypothetical protein K435DRAFT_970954 [Dendrothele bispora CBS 962.96]
MVVSHTEPSTSVAQPTHRKNRRKMSKKSQKIDATLPTTTLHDSDEDMHEPRENITDTLASNMQPSTSGVDDDDDIMIDLDASSLPNTSGAPVFEPLPANAGRALLKSETRRIPVPPHRMTPLKKDWINIFGPLTEILGLQVRMNVQRRCVEARVRKNKTICYT